VGVVPAVVVRVVGEYERLAAGAEAVLVEGEREGQEIVLFRPLPGAVAEDPGRRGFTRRPGRLEDRY
jgi:hypothetical protein